jgi:hypothetical protein
MVRAGDYNLFYVKGNKNNQYRTGSFVQHKIVSAGKRVEFVSDRVSYIVLRGHRCNIIVLNVHKLRIKVMIQRHFYEELVQVFFNHFSQYHMNTLLGDFKAIGKENILKLTIGNQSLQQNSKDNGVQQLILPHSKVWLLRA